MAEAKKIPQRSQVPVEYTWNTADIYPTDEAWEKEFAEVRAQIPVLAGGWAKTPRPFGTT